MATLNYTTPVYQNTDSLMFLNTIFMFKDIELVCLINLQLNIAQYKLLYETFFLQESNFVLNVTAHDHNEDNIGSTKSYFIDFFEFSINTSSGCSFQNRSIRHKPPHCDDAYIELNISYRLVNSPITCPSVCETAILVTHSPEQVFLYVEYFYTDTSCIFSYASTNHS